MITWDPSRLKCRVLCAAFALIGLACVSGCESTGRLSAGGLGVKPGRILEIKPLTGDLSSFKHLEIIDFENRLPGLIRHRVTSDLSGETALEAKLLDRFDTVAQAGEMVIDSNARDTLIVSGKLLDVDTAASHSDAGRRSPVDFLTADVSLIDKTSGQVLARLRVTGFAAPETPDDQQEPATVKNLAKTILHFVVRSRP